MLLAHGTAAWSAIWDKSSQPIAKAGYLATPFDMPPFGWSEHSADNDYSRKKQADRIIALLKALDDRPIVVAHSVGAAPVSEAILRRPDLVKGYIIVAGAIGLKTPPEPGEVPLPLRNSTIREILTSATATNPLLTQTFLRNFMHRKDAATSEMVAALQEPMKRLGYTKAVSAWVPELFATAPDAISLQAASWTKLDLPVHLIWGTEDTVTPLAQGEMLRDIIPGAKLTILTEVGHIPHLEAPEEFNEALLGALDAISAQNQ